MKFYQYDEKAVNIIEFYLKKMCEELEYINNSISKDNFENICKDQIKEIKYRIDTIKTLLKL